MQSRPISNLSSLDFFGFLAYPWVQSSNSPEGKPFLSTYLTGRMWGAFYCSISVNEILNQFFTVKLGSF